MLTWKGFFCQVLSLAGASFLLAGCVGEIPLEPYTEGLKAYKKGDYEQAIERLGYYVEEYPKDENVAAAYLFLGQAYQGTGDHEKALEMFQKAGQVSGQEIIQKQVMIFSLGAYVALERWEEGLEVGNAILQEVTGEEKVMFARELGDLYWKAGMPERGAQFYRDLADQATEPEHRTGFRFALAEQYEKSGELEKQVAVLSGIFHDESLSWETRIDATDDRAAAFYRHGMNEEALASLREIQDASPESDQAVWANVAIARVIREKEPERADELIAKAIGEFSTRVESAPDQDTANYYRGEIARVYHRIGQLETAVQKFREIQEANQDNPYVQESVARLIGEITREMIEQRKIPLPGESAPGVQ